MVHGTSENSATTRTARTLVGTAFTLAGTVIGGAASTPPSASSSSGTGGTFASDVHCTLFLVNWMVFDTRLISW